MIRSLSRNGACCVTPDDGLCEAAGGCTCWRSYHVRAIAETTAPVRRALAPRTLTPAPAPALPIPAPLSDLLIY